MLAVHSRRNMTRPRERKSVLTALDPTRAVSPRLGSAPVRVGFFTTSQKKQ